MSKKKNKKLKKRNTRAGHISSIHSIPVPGTTFDMDVTPELEEKVIAPKVEVPKEYGYDDPLYKDEKKIVVKILLIILGLVIILIGAYYLNQKTTILSSFGERAFKVLNIQTQ